MMPRTVWVRAIAACAAIMCLAAAAPASADVTGACHVSPIVANLDRSISFYRDLLGLEVSLPAAESPRDTTRELLNLHGLPTARLRYFVARIPGARCGIEAVEFSNVERRPVELRMQDPGTVTLILLVRDIDDAFRRLMAAGVSVVTTGGAPVLPSPTSKTRAVIVKDPDGHFVELAQLVPEPATTAPRSSNVIDLRFRVTVDDLDRTVQYYQQHLGIPGKPGAFASSAGVMAMMGLPAAVDYRMSMTPIPGATLMLEFLELKGLERAPVRPRVQDPGAYRLQLMVADVDATVARLKVGGSRVISTDGMPVAITSERPSRLAVMPDPNGLFLVLQQGP